MENMTDTNPIMPEQQKIIDAWDMFEENEPDISTERLYAMVMDHCCCSYEDVTDAVVAEGETND